MNGEHIKTFVDRRVTELFMFQQFIEKRHAWYKDESLLSSPDAWEERFRLWLETREEDNETA
jgi:hypothetical protein